VLWAQTYLHSSRAGYGLLLTVAAVGVVGAALVTGRVMHHFPSARMLLLAGSTAATAYVVLSSTHSAVMAAAALLFEGAAVSMGNVVSFALRQALIPAGLLGRVGNAMRMCIYGAMPAGALIGGVLASVVGVRTMFAGAGMVQLTAVILLRRTLVDVLGSAPGVGVWALAGAAPAVAEPAPDTAPLPRSAAVFDQDVAEPMERPTVVRDHLCDQDRPVLFDQDCADRPAPNVTFA